MIEVCGGSRQLIRILNRLECATSPDTHDRFVTQHAMARRQSKIWDNICSNTFTTATVDNFDMLQSYVAVYCGDQQRSYHGTTLQLVQPDPNSLMFPTSSTEVTTAPIILPNGQGISSDNAHKLGPKHHRTVQVQSLKSTLTTNSAVHPDCTETMSLVAEDLLSKYDNVQDGWVVLVGDEKTYKHLINIKKQYSTALQKLLIFPGD